MTSLNYLKEMFCENARSFKQIDDKTRALLALVVLFNVIFIILNAKKYFYTQHFISPKTLTVIFSFISASAFIYLLKDNLYKTFDFSIAQLKKSFVLGNVTFYLCFLVLWIYNIVMSMFHTKLGGDVQKIRQLAKIDIWQYLTIVMKYVVSLLNEELLLVAVFFIALSLFNKVNVKNVIFSTLASLTFFAILHMFAWNSVTIVSVLMNKLPAVFLFIFFLDIKPLYFSHLFNNCWVSLTMLSGMTGQVKSLIFVLFGIPMALYLADRAIKYEKEKET